MCHSYIGTAAAVKEPDCLVVEWFRSWWMGLNGGAENGEWYASTSGHTIDHEELACHGSA